MAREVDAFVWQVHHTFLLQWRGRAGFAPASYTASHPRYVNTGNLSTTDRHGKVLMADVRGQRADVSVRCRTSGAAPPMLAHGGLSS